MSVEIRRLGGRELGDSLSELARLRIEVFREFPYLYDGCEEAEMTYLENYADAEGAVVVLAMDRGRVVGASTGMPLVAADACFRDPWKDAGERPEEWFYLGESVLRAEYRGRGVGHRFFDEREDHALALGFRKTTFCAVDRKADHPLRPQEYRSHAAFWSGRGYRERAELRAVLGWRQVDSDGSDVENELVFWTREGSAGERGRPRQM